MGRVMRPGGVGPRLIRTDDNAAANRPRPAVGHSGGATGTPHKNTMNPSIHIVGCVLAAAPDAGAINDCVEWARRFGAHILDCDESRAVFVQFDAISAQVILFGCRTALSRKPPLLRFGFASAVKEAAAGGEPRAGERGILQACDLAAAAQPGQVLLSSQLGSLLEVAQIEPFERLRGTRLPLPDGRIASAYEVEPRRAAAAGERPAR